MRLENSSLVSYESVCVGHASTQAGHSLSGHRSHLTALFLSLISRDIIPNGQAMMHIQQATHLDLSISTKPFFSSLLMQLDMHASMHGGSSQCWHAIECETSLSMKWTNVRFLGLGLSSNARNKSFVVECSTAHASSHVRHAMHFVISQNIFFD